MDDLTRSWYELKFDNTAGFASGEAYQGLFCSIMEYRYPGDFQRVCPWGKMGDRKNDGYLKSKRQLFQCYAPKGFKTGATENKIDEDFQGALPYWRDYFSIWTFVHNARDGVPPFILVKLLKLEQDNPGITLNHWGCTELRIEFFRLHLTQIQSILGYMPGERNILGVRMDDVKVVIDHIATHQPLQNTDVRPVPPNKLQANGLSEPIRHFLTLGMQKADLVGRFFDQWSDPTLGDRVASAFRVRYQQLRDEGASPDSIFFGLEQFAGGTQLLQPHQQAAMFAVLAFLFEQCDIYERPLDQVPA